MLTQANEAKIKTEEAEKHELKEIAILEEMIDGNEIDVEEVTDKNPGVLELEDGIYVINSIEDLVFFANDVTTGNNYEGKNVKLGLSLDFNSSKSYVNPFRTDYEKYGYNGELKKMLTTGEGFKTIGLTNKDDKTKNFVGTFDGNGNIINNLYIDFENKESNKHEKIALFSKNYGIIKNLKLLNVNLHIEAVSGDLAGISGQNCITGRIENCIVSGNIKGELESGNIGGITCYSSGNISNSGNFANLNVDCQKIQSEINCNIGGICSSSGMENMKNCFNRGNINVTVSGESEKSLIYIGGLTGQTKGNVSNCYNICSIKINNLAEEFKIGGLIGYSFSGTPMTMEHCYSISSFSLGDGNGNVGGLVGKITHTFDYSGNYYSSSDEINTIGNRPNEGKNCKKDQEYMKQDSFLELMNEGLEDRIWIKDLNNINNGYPILKWQQKLTGEYYGDE